jgi:hypothetical protein
MRFAQKAKRWLGAPGLDFETGETMNPNPPLYFGYDFTGCGKTL